MIRDTISHGGGYCPSEAHSGWVGGSWQGWIATVAFIIKTDLFSLAIGHIKAYNYYINNKN